MPHAQVRDKVPFFAALFTEDSHIRFTNAWCVAVLFDNFPVATGALVVIDLD